MGAGRMGASVPANRQTEVCMKLKLTLAAVTAAALGVASAGLLAEDLGQVKVGYDKDVAARTNMPSREGTDPGQLTVTHDQAVSGPDQHAARLQSRPSRSVSRAIRRCWNGPTWRRPRRRRRLSKQRPRSNRYSLTRKPHAAERARPVRRVDGRRAASWSVVSVAPARRSIATVAHPALLPCQGRDTLPPRRRATRFSRGHHEESLLHTALVMATVGLDRIRGRTSPPTTTACRATGATASPSGTPTCLCRRRLHGKSGVVCVGYGRAGGMQPAWPTQPPPRETVQASHVERYGRA